MTQKYPLTKQQEGLWVEWRLHPENTSYNTCVKLRMKGDLDVPRFEQALKDVVAFFPSLRVYFTEENGLPYQRIADENTFDLEFEDYSVKGQNKETAQQRASAEEFLARKLRTPVDLTTFPIVRAGLAKTTDDTHYFIGLVPHMISDGVSAVLFLESTSIAYNKGYAGLEEAYGDKQKTWDDYFEETNQDENAWKTAADYWQTRMDGAQHSVDFTHGQQEAGNDIKTGKRVYFDIGAELSDKLKIYSRKQRTTLFSTLVGAFGTLVNRYYAQDDLLIGYPVNIRPPGYKHFFGFFVNIIPIRVDLSGDPTFDELVSRVSNSRKADKKFQTFPALDIVREIRKKQTGFDGRVFNVSMAQTVSRLVNLRLDGINSEPLEAEYNDVNDDLSLSYEVMEDGRIGLWFEYREAAFTPEFMDQMIGHMQSLLVQIGENSSQKLSEFKLTDDAQKELFIGTWAHPDKDVPKANEQTIHAMIEAQAQRTPDAVALVYRGETITYAEMNNRAGQVAEYIQAQGVQPGSRIALCAKRGPELILSLLGILKAGCAYVPIAPCYPQERAEFILKDADIKLVLTGEGIEQDFGQLAHNIRTIFTENVSRETMHVGYQGAKTDDAYIIYTSGSTGNPKGVLLSHGNVTPRLNWLQSEMPLSSDEIVLQNTDFSFDVSVAEIFWPLTTGARLILTEAAHYKDPSYIIDLIKQHSITTTCIVPSQLNALLAVLKGELTSLKYVLAAGEALSPSLAKIYYQKCSGTLYNVYGPTEGTIYAAFTKVPKHQDLNNIPIGRPLGDTALYILDDQLRPQPLGVAGELHIGGEGVAQGYINRDDLTAEKFIPDPFNKGAKLYKTGDRTRFKENGDIEYLGRADAQVKIRGFRIELAEIETVISEFIGIEDVAVIDHDGRLVAYYVAASKADETALRAHVTNKLPSYMEPAFFIKIEEIPRLSSGKINRKALPDPAKFFTKRTKHIAPSTKVEKQLAAIWAQILKIEESKIGIHDSFFEIGGDSLMAIQFVCTAEEKGIAFQTDTLFTNATIAELAQIAGEAKAKESAQDVVEGIYPLMPRQAKFFADGFKHPEHWNRFFFFDVNHDMELETLKAAVDKVLLHHDNIRISFVQEGGQWMQRCESKLPDSEYVFSFDISNLSHKEQENSIVQTCNQYHASLKFNDAPLLRILHFKTGESAGKMAIIMHHLLVDIVSSRIVFEDLLKAYESARLNIPIPLTPKTASVKEWATKITEDSKTQNFASDLAYWATPKMQPSPSIKTDYAGITKGQEKNGAAHIIKIDQATTESLLKDIPKNHDMSIQDMLLACLLKTTKAWTGEDEMLVNICGHGRDPVKGYNFGRTAGWLNTVYPVHLCNAGLDQASAQTFTGAMRKQLDRIPKTNGNYNVLRYISKHPEILKYDTPQLFFNYVSQIDALMPEGAAIQPIIEPEGIKGSHGDNHLCYLLYIEAAIVNKELNIHITYTKDVFKPETVENVGNLYKNAIIQSVQGLTQQKEKLLVS